jgi:putative aminopeptidase FrvX
MVRFARVAALLSCATFSLFGADAPPRSINPQIQSIVSQVSAERIADIQRKLETFGTRNIYSSTDDPAHGVGAAREWIASQFKSYSPKLQVTFDKHRLAGVPGKRYFKNVEIWNVVAVLPGTSEPDRHVMVSGHYDTINLVYKTDANGKRVLDNEGVIAAPAPGVTDDGSGTAAVMELARVMSQFEYRKTIVFVAFAAEEYGLLGSTFYAQDAASRHQVIEGLFNNDIIGSNIKANGQTSNQYVNVYSESPEDSVSRQLARYLKEMGERYQPSFAVNMVFRHDRFGRGGDHSPFAAIGFPAVRITTPMENFDHQHTATDTFANTAPSYTALVAKANAAAVASLALAPKPPELRVPAAAEGRAYTSALSRGSGEKGYDAVLRWHNDNPEPDLAGYEVVLRKSTSPDWEQSIFVGNVLTYTLPNVNIDEVIVGVRAVDRNGNESTVSAYVTSPYVPLKLSTY